MDTQQKSGGGTGTAATTQKQALRLPVTCTSVAPAGSTELVTFNPVTSGGGTPGVHIEGPVMLRITDRALFGQYNTRQQYWVEIPAGG